MRYFTSMFPDHCAAIMKLLHLPRVVLDNASRMNLNFLHVAKARHETGVPGLTAVKAALISEKMGKMRSISFSQIIFCLKSILFKLKRATMLERFFASNFDNASGKPWICNKITTIALNQVSINAIAWLFECWKVWIWTHKAFAYLNMTWIGSPRTASVAKMALETSQSVITRKSSRLEGSLGWKISLKGPKV